VPIAAGRLCKRIGICKTTNPPVYATFIDGVKQILVQPDNDIRSLADAGDTVDVEAVAAVQSLCAFELEKMAVLCDGCCIVCD
jgi:hypothetical protein